MNLLLTPYQKSDTFEKEYIAYEGEYFTIEWFYSRNGKSDVLDFFNALADSQKRKVLILFKRMGDAGRINDVTKFRNEGDKIFAFKPQPDRFLSFSHTGKKIILTNAFCKKSDKMPKNEKEKAHQRMNDYLARVAEGTYYEK